MHIILIIYFEYTFCRMHTYFCDVWFPNTENGGFIYISMFICVQYICMEPKSWSLKYLSQFQNFAPKTDVMDYTVLSVM